ncbi:hypothetical protein CLIB1423_03S05358 [[Candida] railenensis]|uniref:Uncharacterized protein n=1 Tax=[Candida] railenensis TaxID=45579 RepID=A0A9P0VXE8_9ASCO|nr:hypothetical protein CLIB1423_03S05358 [[Candida] railenensis]
MEKISKAFGSKKDEGQASHPSDAPPPSYEASEQQHNYDPSAGQQQSYGGNFSEGKQNYDANANHAYNNNNNNYNDGNNFDSYQPQPSNYDPMQDPNVIKVPPQKVNIASANPQHLNPSYPQFQQREQDRRKFGHQDPVYKHGAPLSQGHVNPNSKTGGSAFPGSSGATYNNAANK